MKKEQMSLEEVEKLLPKAGEELILTNEERETIIRQRRAILMRGDNGEQTTLK